MSAQDYFVEVGSPGSATTLDANYTATDTTVTVVSTTNWPSTGKAVIFAIDTATVINGEEVQTAGTYCEFEGTVASATSITNVDYKLGDGDQNFSAGSLTRVYIPVSAERENRLAVGLALEHKQTGLHGAVTADSLVIADAGTIEVDTINEATAANGVTVDGMSIKDGLVVGASGKGVLNSSFGTGAGELGAAWQTFDPSVTGFSGTPTETGYYVQVGKMVTIFFDCTGTSDATTLTMTLPVATVRIHQVPTIRGRNNGAIIGPGLITTTAASTTMSFFSTNAGGAWTASGTKAVFGFTFSYEVA